MAPVLLAQLDCPARAARKTGRFLQGEGGGAVDVPRPLDVDGPAGLGIAIDGVGRGEAVLGGVRLGADKLHRLGLLRFVPRRRGDGDLSEYEVAVRRPPR